MNRFEFEAIGTRWLIDIFDELSSLQLNELDKKIHKRIDEFDLAYSRFRADSLVTQMSRAKGTYVLPADANTLMRVYRKLYDLTDGVFTPLIGQVLADAGYDAEYSLKPKQLTSPQKWEDVIEYKNNTITLHEPALLDFGAGGKGYLIDLVGEVLERERVTGFCIDAGGDILCKTVPSQKTETLQIGLENPENTEQVIGIANIQNQSICGSAGNRRSWGEFHHMINPKTLQSPRNIVATWVVADEAVVADAVATALFFVQPQMLENDFEFQYVILHADFSVDTSSDFPAEFFYNE